MTCSSLLNNKPCEVIVDFGVGFGVGVNHDCLLCEEVDE